MRTLLTVALLVVVAGCGTGNVATGAGYDSEGTGADLTTTPVYQDASDYLALNGGDQGAWFDARDSISTAFDQVCGDTFCEGDYNPIRTLTFTCSVKISTGIISTCKWVFAGAYATISPTTGTITSHDKVWKCTVPLNGMKPKAFVDFVTAAGGNVLNNALPNGRGNIYDGLGTCLTGT